MTCKHYERKLEESDRHFVYAEEFNNCVLCLVEKKGPMTQEIVGEYLKITKMRVSQIEKRALNKLGKRCKFLLGKNLFTE